MKASEFRKFASDIFHRTGKLFGEFDVTCPEEDHAVSKWIRQDGYWEDWVSSAVYRLLNKDDIFVNVGAHIGYYCMLARFVGVKDIYAYEPNISTYKYLFDNCGRFAHCYNLALSNTRGYFPFYTVDNNFGGSNLFGGKFVYNIATDTLDNQNILPSVIMIDAEGAEKDIILGGMNTIKKTRPKIIVEVSEGRDYNINDIMQIEGYDAFFVDYNGNLIRYNGKMSHDIETAVFLPKLLP